MLRCVMILMAACLLTGAPAHSHHSHANYAMTEYLNVSGTVTSLLWINPHIWIYLEVSGGDGEPELWSIEAANPVQVARNGVTRDTVRVGDTVTARCHRLRDGSNGCLLGYMTGRDGIERHWD